MPTEVVVLGRSLGPQDVELLGTGRPTFIVATTRVTAGVRRRIEDGHGGKVLADIEPGNRDGVACNIATVVRDIAPTSEDVDRLRAVLGSFGRAGIKAFPGAFPGDAEEHASTVLASLVANDAPFWDAHGYLVEQYLHNQVCFPDFWWHDDPKAGIDEMVGLLERVVRVRGTIPTRMILSAAREDLDRPDTDEDEARDRLCAVLCKAANVLLETEGKRRRFCGPFDGGNEPNWILCQPTRYEALLREGILSPWTGQRTKESHVCKRPPDRGEIELENFPSGDDPF